MSTKFVRPNWFSDGDTFAYRGLTFRVWLPYDDGGFIPWVQEGLADFVRDAPGVRDAKRQGEIQFGGHLADVPGLILYAVLNEWGIQDDQRLACAAHFKTTVDKITDRQIKAYAVHLAIERWRAWCNDEWSYVGVVVHHEPRAGVILEESLWDIESDANEHIIDVALELADQLISQHGLPADPKQTG